MSHRIKPPACAPAHRCLNKVVWLAILAAFSWAPASADNRANPLLDEHINASFRSAPFSVFLATLLTDTGLDIQIEKSIDVKVTGDYSGTVSEVLEGVIDSLSLKVEIDPTKVRVYEQLIVTAPLVTSAAEAERIAASNLAVASKPVLTKPDIQLSLATRLPKPRAVRKPKPDEFVERLFLLKNVDVSDKTLNDSHQTVIPGAVTQLRKLIRSIGAEDLTFQNESDQNVSHGSVSIVTLASMNAVMIRDRSSKMALYRDLIDSIDSSSLVGASKPFKKEGNESNPVWTAVK